MSLTIGTKPAILIDREVGMHVNAPLGSPPSPE